MITLAGIAGVMAISLIDKYIPTWLTWVLLTVFIAVWFII